MALVYKWRENGLEGKVIEKSQFLGDLAGVWAEIWIGVPAKLDQMLQVDVPFIWNGRALSLTNLFSDLEVKLEMRKDGLLREDLPSDQTKTVDICLCRVSCVGQNLWSHPLDGSLISRHGVIYFARQTKVS